MYAKTALVIAVAASAAAVLVPTGLAGSSGGGAAVVGVAQSTLGRILVDGRGRTLYLFEKDARGRSSCSGACAAVWPPLISTGKPQARSGARASVLGRTKRSDGRWQVTYNRHPLYTYVGDTKRGQTNGEGLADYGAEWYALSPAGAKVENDNALHGSAGDPAPSGYGYGG